MKKSKIAFTATGKDLGQSCPTCLSGIEPTIGLEPGLAQVLRES